MAREIRRLRLVVFDMAGTTVDDKIDGSPLVLKSYDDAFRRHGIVVSMDVLNEQRGRDKRTVIEEFGGDKAPEIYEFFVSILLANTRRVREIEGVSETFRFLQDSGIRVATGTGFPYDVARGIIDHLGWERSGLVDFWTCSEMVGASRPDPAMIHAAMRHLKIEDPMTVMKVDDTAKGIEEGLRAGVVTLGVLTGTQSRERLQAANPTDIIQSVKHLPSYLREKGYL
ncbi:MAG: HAD-IA family hydrolase [Candidatus Bathyarchaeia archaeon]